MKNLMTTTCYHCDAAATEREHVPPKSLFPKGVNWSRLITVPSCVTHNSAKSNADEYLKFLLGATTARVPNAIRRSVARSVVRLAAMGSSVGRYGFRSDAKTLALEEDFPLDFELLSACLEKIARALYFHHHSGRRKLLGCVKVWPLFIPVDPRVAPELALKLREIRALTDQDFDEQPREGAHQEIFAYQVLERRKFVVVNMEFYGMHRTSAMSAVA